jgi:nitrile hydratase accessory protein
MAQSADGRVFPELEGAAALPRSNGEPVFDAPWQSRAFGMVVHLHESGVYPWDDFKERLIASIDASGETESNDPAAYYRQFTAAFCKLLVERGILTPEEIERRTEQERHAAEHEHDHEHPHEH